jgi:hypothetical protein
MFRQVLVDVGGVTIFGGFHQSRPSIQADLVYRGDADGNTNGLFGRPISSC